jgi:hypothetical protein
VKSYLLSFFTACDTYNIIEENVLYEKNKDDTALDTQPYTGAAGCTEHGPGPGAFSLVKSGGPGNPAAVADGGRRFRFRDTCCASHTKRRKTKTTLRRIA